MSAITLTVAQKAILDLLNTTLDNEYTSGLLNPDSSVNAAFLNGYSGLSPGNQDQIRAVMRQYMGALLHQLEDWTVVGSGGAPVFQNSWVNYNSGFNTCAFYKDPFGVVHLRGLVTGGTVSANIFTLPVGYIPPARYLFSTISDGATGRLDVDALGNVICVTGSNVWFSLDGIQFRTT